VARDPLSAADGLGYMVGMASAHAWKFFRAGGVDQVVLADAEDLRNLPSLDQKLWAALACPSKGLEIDERTLALLDSDANGRIRPPEVLAAIGWLDGALRDLGEVFKPSDELPLDSIAKDKPAGKDILAGAKLVLQSLGKGDAKTISLAEVSSTEAIFVATKLNGDGIVPADSADDEETKKAIEDVIAVLGSVPDRSTKPGVDQPKVDTFFDQIKLHADWLDAGRTAASRVLGDGTAAAAEGLEAVRAKVDDYFARCRLAAFDARAAAALNATEVELQALGPLVLTAETGDAAKLPLARVEAGRPLPLESGVNPAWAARVAALARATVAPVLGAKTSLNEADWTTIKQRLAPYADWMAAKPATDVAKLGDERVTALAKSDARARITELVAKDAALATQASQIESIEKLIRFRRDIVRFLTNFVNFAEFYGKRTSIFQTGTLYVDARSCTLCLAVEDVGRHALLAGKSQAYLVYCDCVRRADQAKRIIVAAVTGGDTDNLMVGRNGVLYDRAGSDWDATITKIVENPISVRQAFWLPYKRFVRLVEEQFARRAKAADDESNKKLDMVAAETASVGAEEKAKEDAAAAAKPKGIDIGTVAAIGVAVGGIATFFSSILATFLGLGMWMPAGLLALILAISGPSMLLAWLKLRQRNIGPILDANGWAVNTMARVNVPFGGALTALAALPPGASRSLQDPFAERKTPWKTYLFLLVILALAALWALRRLDAYLPEKIGARTVLHLPPPAAAPASEK
jgi:hypothetical protein